MSLSFKPGLGDYEIFNFFVLSSNPDEILWFWLTI